MLTEDRHAKIMELLAKNGSVQAADLCAQLGASVSTIRRDLEMLEKQGQLSRVHGGAIQKKNTEVHEEKMDLKRQKNWKQKEAIASVAADLIEPGDFVWIDAGTSTEALALAIEAMDASFATNAITHAVILADKGMDVSVIGGSFKVVTQAIIGEQALQALEDFNFDKGFFGTNAIDDSGKLSTPDVHEAALKRKAMQACRQCYVLADPSKFSKKSRCNFGSLDGAILISTHKPEGVEEGHFIPAQDPS